jgi:integrase/recombinase XerD
VGWLDERHQVVHPDTLTREHVEAWVKHVKTVTTAKGVPLRPNSVIKQIDCDRVFLLWLAAQGVVSAVIPATLPKIKPPDVLPTSVLTHQQMMRLLRAVDRTTSEGVQIHAMLEFLYSSGARVSELLGLDIDKIDLRNSQAILWGKGSKERVVAIGESAARATEAYLKAFRPTLCHDGSERALWLDRQGARMPYATFRRKLLAIAQRVGLPVIATAHTFRRSFATEMVRAGANLWLIQVQMGSASVEALRPYIKLTIPDLKKTHARCHPREKDAR